MNTSFNMSGENITMIRGDTLSFGFEVMFSDESDQNLDAVYFSCKSNTNDNYIFQKSLTDGIENRGNGKYVVRVAPEDTENVEAGSYYYDLQIQINGDVYTPLIGVLDILMDVTTN